MKYRNAIVPKSRSETSYLYMTNAKQRGVANDIEVHVPQRMAVIIDDGSGSIKVGGVEEDLIIIEDGGGSLSYSDIRGTVEQDT